MCAPAAFARNANVVPTPLTNPGTWVTSDDYPADALAQGAEGTSGFLVSVGADGRVSNCVITQSSGSEKLDNATCETMRQRALFDPARDRRGKATPSFYRSRVVWKIPKTSGLTVGEQVVRVSIDVDETGHIKQCVVEKMELLSEGSTPPDPCSGHLPGNFLQIIQGADGKARAGRITQEGRVIVTVAP